jgi:hypothetical protein
MKQAKNARHPVRRALVHAQPSWLLCVALLGCGGEGKGEKKDEAPDFAKAFDNTAQIDTKANDKRMKELEEKAAKQAADARKAELEQITSLTPPLPADVATACAEAGAAFDEFKTKRLTAAGDEAMLGRWNATKEPDVRKFVEACTAMGKLEIGACLTNAHRSASLAMFGEGATDDFAARCQERWGGGTTPTPAPAPQ